MSRIDEVRVINQSTVINWEKHFMKSAMFRWFVHLSWIQNNLHSHYEFDFAYIRRLNNKKKIPNNNFLSLAANKK